MIAAVGRDPIVLPVACLVLSNVLMLAPHATPLRLLGGILLFCAVPGLALTTLVFSGSPRIGPIPRILLGIAMSYVLSNLVILGLVALPGGLDVWQLVGVLNVVSVLLIVSYAVRRKDTDNGQPRPSVTREDLVHLIVLVVVLGVFRFIGLGYSVIDYGDELPIVEMVAELIEGRGAAVLLEHGKGPVEVTTSLAFVLFDHGYDEFALRLPFAFASIISVLMVYLLGRNLISARTGFVAALLLSLDGTYLGKCRWAQYQAIVVLMAVSAVYCFWRAGSDTRKEDRTRFLALGTILFGFGCLTHYGGIIVLPVLALLYLSQKKRPWKRERPLLCACVAVLLAFTLPFYVPFFFSQELSTTRSYYFGNRLGWGTGIYNNLRFFLEYSVFPSSVYYVAFAWAGLMGAVAVLCRRSLVNARGLVVLSGMSFVVGLLISFCCPDLLQMGNVNLGFVFFLPLLAAVIWGRGIPLLLRVPWMWFIPGFIVLAFFARRPLTHWYVIAAPWALLSGIAVEKFIHWLERRVVPARRVWLIWTAFTALMILFAGYLYVVFLQQTPAYADKFPKHKHPLYWTPQDKVPGTGNIALYGTPQEKGWEAIGYLYRIGSLRGSLRVGNRWDTHWWYIGHKWDRDDNSRYVLLTGTEIDSSFTPEAIEQWYDLVGRVLAGGVPKLWLYERKEFAQGGPVVDYSLEEYEPLYEELVSLDESLRFDAVRADKKTYYREAGLVEAMSEPGDEIVFTERAQVGLFSYHYTGDLPYHLPSQSMEPEDLENWLQEWEGPGKMHIAYWAASEGGEHAKWDEWLAANDRIREKAWHENVGLAVYSDTGEVDLHLLDGSRLGASIELLGYEARYIGGGREVELVLYWAVEQYVANDYTVFTHLVDDGGNLVGQKDNPPGRGLMPTSAWRTDKVIRDEYEIPVDEVELAEYWIEVGMYDAVTGDRLSTSGEGAQPDGRIRLPQPVMVGRSQAER